MMAIRSIRPQTQDGLMARVFITGSADGLGKMAAELLIEQGHVVVLHHHGAATDLNDLTWEKRRWNGSAAYAESKFHDVLLAFAMARRFPNVRSNALEPGWVPTKMGGSGAPDDLDKGNRTQVWLATSDEPAASVSGQYFFHQ